VANDLSPAVAVLPYHAFVIDVGQQTGHVTNSVAIDADAQQHDDHAVVGYFLGEYHASREDSRQLRGWLPTPRPTPQGPGKVSCSEGEPG
jgi:hypothetical protein